MTRREGRWGWISGVNTTIQSVCFSCGDAGELSRERRNQSPSGFPYIHSSGIGGTGIGGFGGRTSEKVSVLLS